MSCWVVPTIAAELWGVPVDHVLSEIRSGSLDAKVDYGFVVVDVSPYSPHLAPPPRPVSAQPVSARPMQTYVAADDLLSDDLLSPVAPAVEDDSGHAPALPIHSDEYAAPDAPLATSGMPSASNEDPLPYSSGALPAVELNALESAAFGEPVNTADSHPQPAATPPGDAVAGSVAVSTSEAALTSEAELRALSEPLPVAAAGSERVRRRRRAVAAPPPPPAPVVAIDEDEMGPDPNDGEPDDGKPLDWRAARSRAATRRRPPPRRFG